MKRLALASDIVMENFRPGVLERLGLSADALRKEKPSLIWCSISGFGQDGPYRNKPAYDMIVQALSGGMSLTGEAGGAAVRAGIPVADLGAGLYSAIAVLAALNRRHATGKGETIDISMLDCQAAMLCYQAAYYMHSGVVPGRQGRGHEFDPDLSQLRVQGRRRGRHHREHRAHVAGARARAEARRSAGRSELCDEQGAARPSRGAVADPG